MHTVRLLTLFFISFAAAAAAQSPENASIGSLAPSIGMAFAGVGHPAFGALMVMSIMTLLIGLFWRDIKLLLLSGLCASTLAALLFADGMSWKIQGFNALGPTSPVSMFFVCLSLFFALRYTRELLGILPVKTKLLSQSGKALEAVLIAVCVLCVLITESLAPVTVRIVASIAFASAAVALLSSAARYRSTKLRPALLVNLGWVWLASFIILHNVADVNSFMQIHGLKLAASGGALLLGLAYFDHLMTLGRRLNLRLAADGGNADSPGVERSRRDFAEEVSRLVDQLDPEFYEEAIMERFLEYLSNMLPVAAAAVAVSHRGDVRLVVSARSVAREEFESILATREELLQSVCLSDRAAVIHSDDLGVAASPAAASCLGIVPVRARRNEWAGVLLARSGELEFGLDELELVSDFAHQAYESIRNAQKFRRVKRQAETDPLTGIFNRRAVMARGQRAFRKHRSLHEPLAILFVDIDHFKAVNDEYGHDVGDSALREVATCCAACLRDDDFLGRYGGEEFLAVLPGASAREAQIVAERLRAAVEHKEIVVNANNVRLTVSVGIAELNDKFVDLETMLRAADRALYRAKREGRNRVIHHRYMLRGDRVRKHI